MSACAGSKGASNVLQPIGKTVELGAYHALQVSGHANNGVVLQSYELERLESLIKTKVHEAGLEQFKQVCSGSCEDKSGLSMEVEITRYDKGNAAARFFLAGLGQIHIDAIVKLVDKTTGKLLAKSEVSKTFAWGGIYGGATTIEDVEPAFAEAVVDILLPDGKKEKQIKKVKKEAATKAESSS